MAPEQRAGEADARSDQWSFCRALEEALAGKRVPRAIRRALARGTAEDPAARFPSMVPLLAELGRDRRRATIWAAAALAVVGAGAIALARPSAAPCAQAGASVADLWTPDVEARLDATFQATGRGTAKEALGAVARHLSSFAGEARTAYRAACEATHVRHEQSEDLLDLRTSCLDAQVAEARALVGILAHADAELVGKAAEAVHRLPSPAPCADARSLLAPVRPPTDPQTRLRVAELRGALAIAEANAFVGRFQESRSLAEKVVADARTLGYRPLVADALRVVGEAATQLGDVPAGISALRESVWMAEASHHDRTAADAWTSLVFAVSEADKGLDRVDEWIERAEAAIERIGGDVHISSRLAINKGAVSYRRGNFADARAAWEKALQLEESHLLPDHPDLARAHNNLAVALDELGDPRAAEAHYERAMAIWERAFGPHNAYLGTAVGNLAFIYRGRGELARAVETMQRSVAILTTALGEGNPTLVRNQQNLGDMLVTAGRVDEGVATLERVVAIQERARGANHPATAIALLSLGTAKRAQGKLDEAIACQERAVRIYRETQGARSPHTALAETGLGEALISKGQYAQAVPLLEGALSVFTEAYGRKHANTAYALSDLGRAYLGVGKPDKALPLLEEALAARAGGETPELAETRFLLARALWDGGGDRARAIELAEAAMPKLDAGGAADLDVKKWLAARR
jgi:tetratricopeptide (TPR) repeat protein